MIESDLLKMGVAHAVPAAVAHVDQPAALVFRQQRHQRGAHAVQVLAALRAHEDGRIGAGDSLFGVVQQRVGPVTAGEQPHHFVHGQGAGNFACSCAAHSVAHNIDAVLNGKAECILIGRALAAKIRDRRGRIVCNNRGQE